MGQKQERIDNRRWSTSGRSSAFLNTLATAFRPTLINAFKLDAAPGHSRRLLLLALCLALGVSAACAQVPFHRGVNLTQWFQVSSTRQVQFSKFTRKDFEQIKGLGCDAVRLPINLHAMTSGTPDYTIDPLFFTFMDEVADWTEELGIHLILDNHTFDPIAATDPDIRDALTKVWTQMADHYKSRSALVYYEVLNEPHGIAADLWGEIQQDVIDAIRTVDATHYIIVGGINYNSYNDLATLPNYTDSKLIYTFHFYDPFLFTHQGADWSDPSLAPLAGMPFPYGASSMPALPSSLRGTWIESAYNSYPTEGTVARVKQLIDIAAAFSSNRGVPVYCGELGVFIPNSDPAQRVAWYKVVSEYLQQKNIPWTTWDYQGGFGLFEKDSDELFDFDLNVPLLQALKLNVPPQSNPIHTFQTDPFYIYDDYLASGVVDASYAAPGTLDYYNPDAYDGKFCIQMTNVDQYFTIGLDFRPDLDMSLMPENGFSLDFWVKGDSPGTSFDIRFVDTKSGASDHPWRMGITVDQTLAPWNNEWHHVSIPLAMLQEKGSYDNSWFPAEGKFSWHETDRLEIVAEMQSLAGVTFQFDDIKVNGEPILVTAAAGARSEDLVQVSPNPASTALRIQYQVAHEGTVTASLISMLGRVVCDWPLNGQEPGAHDASVQIGNVPAGLYLLRLDTPEGRLVRKVVIE